MTYTVVLCRPDNKEGTPVEGAVFDDKDVAQACRRQLSIMGVAGGWYEIREA